MTDSQQPQPQQEQVSAEDRAKLDEVGQAGAAAAAKGENAAAAMKDKRDEVGLKMSDEDIEQVAEQLFDKFAELMKGSGMMDPPVATVQPPAEAPPPPAPPPPSAAEPVPPVEAPQPKKRTAAQRFLGVD